MFTLKGRTALIFGGTKGIGFTIAKKFAEAEMNVIVLSSNLKNVQDAVNKYDSLGLNVDGYCCDLRNLDSIDDIFEKIYLKYSSFDVLVNSAGILDLYPIDEITENQWNEVIAVNLNGTFFAIQKSIKYLQKSNFPRVINISSNAGRMGGFENGLAYSASKGAIIALTYGFARRLADKSITVNCIAPGTIKSEMSDEFSEASKFRLLSRFPLGRFGTTDEVAAAACYFASEEASFTTGAVLDVNGGLFMG
jgi:3-oxoacyl-[acyl-carrier protein] reductase